jgi:hypothetical protein
VDGSGKLCVSYLLSFVSISLNTAALLASPSTLYPAPACLPAPPPPSACSIASIIPVLEQVLKTQRPLLIISEDVESGGRHLRQRAGSFGCFGWGMEW